MAANEAAASLATRLREATAELHHAAERSALMQALLRGQTTPHHYARLLQQLLPLYAALEPLVTARVDASDAPAWLREAWAPGLARLAALQHDLATLAAPAAAPLPATQAYVERLAALDGLPAAQCDPRLLAHVYVRHLGDLSGGQVLQRTLARAFGSDQGLRFHQFGDPAAVAQLKARLRGALAALPAQGPLADAAVDEALWAFAQHIHLFDELAAAG